MPFGHSRRSRRGGYGIVAGRVRMCPPPGPADDARHELLRRCVDEFDQTVVMVTHDPAAAGRADRALFLADGRVVDELWSPTVEQVLDRVRAAA
jgi:hypothetical protein